MPEPTRRTAVRVLPVNDRGAALPELREETGIAVDPPVLTERFLESTSELSWGGTSYRRESTFDGIAHAYDREIAISSECLDDDEVDNVFEARWWRRKDLADAGGTVSDDIPEITDAALRAVLGGTDDHR